MKRKLFFHFSQNNFFLKNSNKIIQNKKLFFNNRIFFGCSDNFDFILLELENEKALKKLNEKIDF